MIVQRFRSMMWLAIVAVAATTLYLVSLRVSVERASLQSVEAQIARAERDIVTLQTELGTRASLRQLEKWNVSVLALSAPSAKQYVRDEVRLASLDASGAVPSARPATLEAPVMQAALTTEAKRPAIRTASYERPQPATPSDSLPVHRAALVSVSGEKAVAR